MTKRILSCLSILLVTLLVFATYVQAADKYRVNEHFVKIEPVVPRLDENAEHEVVELFWYGCPHCYQFEPHLDMWLEEKPENVAFIRIPAVMSKRWEPHARAYYALEIMGQLDVGHALLFEGIHEQGRRLVDLDSMARFLSQHGIDEQQFRENYESFAVETKVNRARELLHQYNVTGVPAVIVDGEYKVSAQLAGGHTQVIEVIEQLAQ